ncbi:glycerate kinase [Glycomyces algeriensis]|uniref:Glycerate kinase n=1 Tax=Glycomyces algeriensis TaxID=256037 RepID=A0A9W6GB45_9ACTN|nr:glycerate kinase [Glycomyces algeriensis]MDA1367886.1 glycerate kinase [Glycomyces algeriensis]MDR7352033.1 glycerate kinase [Glycomyces algeriensis]GLI44765.1 putative glycerate kinase [Glycomyces algeriensis]
MRILIAPDKFAGTMSAAEAADAVAAGWRRARPGDTIVTLPLADGGPGFVDVLAHALPEATLRDVDTCDPLGRPVVADYLRDGETAYIESAEACGLHLLEPSERDPRRTTSYGLGIVLAHAIEQGAKRLVIGLGGSATNDAGAGMLTALGLTLLDSTGAALPYGGGTLSACAGIEGHARTRGVEIIAATDVDSPLLGPHGATYMFGPQKGATGNALPFLELSLSSFAELAERTIGPVGASELPGAGAAGGLGFAFFLLGGRRESGARLTCDAVGLDAKIAAADLVITGEGSFDAQSLRGKLAAEVASGARAHGRPCLVMAGRSDLDSHPDLAGVHSVTELLGSPEAAMAEPAAGLTSLAEKVAKEWQD